jgi:hypothetical protein
MSVFGGMAVVPDKALAQQPVIVAEFGKKNISVRNTIHLSILIDEKLFSEKVCKEFGTALEGTKAPWNWGLGQVRGCYLLAKEPSKMDDLLDWQLIIRAVDSGLAIELCRPTSDLLSQNKICFAGFKFQKVDLKTTAIEDSRFALLVAAGLLEQTPIFMNNPKLNPRRVRFDKRLPRELQKSPRSVPVAFEFKNDAKELNIVPASEELEKIAFMNFTLSRQVRRATYEKHIFELLKSGSGSGEKVVEALPWVPPLQQEDSPKEKIQNQKSSPNDPSGQESTPIKFDVEIAAELFSKESCHIFQSLMDVGIGPWFLKLGDFSSCRIKAASNAAPVDLNNWKIVVESESGELNAAMCRPLRAGDEPDFVCYAHLKIKNSSGFFAAMRDVRFVALLLGYLYELAPVSAYATFDSPPGGRDKRFPDELTEPAKLRPMELTYVKAGQLYKLLEIRKEENSKHQGKRVFWSKQKTFKPRQELFSTALNSLVSEINLSANESIKQVETVKSRQSLPTAVPEISSKTPKQDVIVEPKTHSNTPSASTVFPSSQISRDAQLAEETRLKAAKAAAAAKETALKADAEAREAAAQAAAAKSYAAAQEAAAREAAKREAAAKEAAAKEAAAKEKAAREAAQEYARQAEREAAIKEAVAKANVAREAAQKAEAAARAAVAAAKLVAPKDDVEVLEEQIPAAEEVQPDSSRKDLRFFVAGLPVQETYRDKMPAHFRLGFDSGLWNNSAISIGVWADFGRTFFIQRFQPEVVPNDVEDPDSVASQVAVGDRAQSRLGLSLATSAQFNNSLLGLSLLVGSVNFTSKWDYDRTLLLQTLGQVDGTASTAGVKMSFAPVQALGGFVFDLGADFISGRGLNGNLYALDLGWRFLNYSGSPVRRRIRAKFDFFTSIQMLTVKATSLVDGVPDVVNSTSAALGVRIGLL